jgi:hypothetical protein
MFVLWGKADIVTAPPSSDASLQCDEHARSHRDVWFDDPAKIVKPVGAELIGDG